MESFQARKAKGLKTLAGMGAVLLLCAAASAQVEEGFTPQGAISQWLVMGPFPADCNLPAGCVMPATACDYITDGTIAADTWEPKLGEAIATDFGGAALASSWLCRFAAIADPSIDCAANPNPKTMLFDSQESRGYIDLNNFFSGGTTTGGNGGTGDPENVVAYAWTYVINNTGGDLEVMLGHNSDDSYRVLVNFEEVGAGLACRPPNPDTYDQEVLGPVNLHEGRNVIMVQTWEGCCNWGFRLRLMLPAEEGEIPVPVTFPDVELDVVPDFYVARDIPSNILAGDTITVTLELVNDVVPPVQTVEIRERIPIGWTALNPSTPGTIETDAAGRQTIVWKLTGGPSTQTLSYDLEVPNPYANIPLSKSFMTADGVSLPIIGDRAFTGGSSPNPSEALVVYMKQGTTGAAGANPGEAQVARDWLTDGEDLTEVTVVPKIGESIAPDFGGASPSPGPMAVNDLTWARLAATNGWFPLNPNYDEVMGYVATYVVNPTGKTLRVGIGSASDDSEQILVDGKQVWIHAIARGAGTASPQDHSPLFDLAPGKHLVLQKVFEGGGGFDSSFRFEDEEQNPIVNVRFTLDPGPDKPNAGDPAYALGQAFIIRKIPTSLDPGETGTISLRLKIKAPPIVGGTIEETVPAGWTILGSTPAAQVAGQKLTWTLSGNLSDTEFTYTVQVPEGATDAVIRGSAVLGGVEAVVAGDQSFTRGIMSQTGFIKQWLVLGPLETSGLWLGDQTNPNVNFEANSATPENGDIRVDYLSDGTLNEKNIRPFDGMRISPQFGGSGITDSKAVGLESLTRECAPEEPTWEAFISPSGTFDNNAYFGADINSHATYAAAYVTNMTASPIATNVAFNSDDAFIVFLDGTEIGVYEPGPCSNTACGRGYGAEDTVAEVLPVTIPPGEHFLLTRVHDGGGGSGHRLRFQDNDGNPLLPGPITVSLKSASSPPDVYMRRVLSTTSYKVSTPFTATVKVESAGAHSVQIHEVLPAGWSAADITDGGSQAAGIVSWNLNLTAGSRDVSYRLVPGDCPGSGSFCSNGASGSTYTVDGKTHSLRGDSSFRRDSTGNDALDPWDVRDIGYTGGGTQRTGPRAVDVMGKGAGVKAKKDEFRFVSIPASGDFSISTQVFCIDDPIGSGQSGLMVRDTFDTFSAHLFFSVASTPLDANPGKLKAVYRPNTNATSPVSTRNIVLSDADVLAFPFWIRLDRTGAKLSLKRSSDGVTYTEVATKDIGSPTVNNQIDLKNDTLIGLAVTGGTGGTTLASFREVSGIPPLPEFPTPIPPPNAPQNLQGTATSGKVDLTWQAPVAGGPAFSGYIVVRDGVKIADRTAQQTSYSDTSVVNGTNYCYQVKAVQGSAQSPPSNTVCLTPGGAGGTFKRGDVDGNGVIDISDPVALLGALFLGTGDPACLEAADFDDGGTVDITDAVNNLGYQFLGTGAPAAPGPLSCGPDPAGTFLGCSVFCP